MVDNIFWLAPGFTIVGTIVTVTAFILTYQRKWDKFESCCSGCIQRNLINFLFISLPMKLSQQKKVIVGFDSFHTKNYQRIYHFIYNNLIFFFIYLIYYINI